MTASGGLSSRRTNAVVVAQLRPAPRSLLDVAAREAASLRRRGGSVRHARAPRPRARTRGAAACVGTPSSLPENDDRLGRRDGARWANSQGGGLASPRALPCRWDRVDARVKRLPIAASLRASASAAEGAGGRGGGGGPEDEARRRVGKRKGGERGASSGNSLIRRVCPGKSGSSSSRRIMRYTGTHA